MSVSRRYGLKKGQPKRFRLGNLVIISSAPTGARDQVSTWNCHPVYNDELDVAAWNCFARVVGFLKSNQIYTVIQVHNFPYPSKDQYCLVLDSGGKSGWVSANFLEKIR